MPDPMIGEFCRIVCDTLKASGNVLVPCYPSGILYDLFECLSNQMDMNGLTTVPMFFFSPVADSSLAYSNIMAEWLSVAKHNRLKERYNSKFQHGFFKSEENLFTGCICPRSRSYTGPWCGAAG